MNLCFLWIGFLALKTSEARVFCDVLEESSTGRKHRMFSKMFSKSDENSQGAFLQSSFGERSGTRGDKDGVIRSDVGQKRAALRGDARRAEGLQAGQKQASEQTGYLGGGCGSHQRILQQTCNQMCSALIQRTRRTTRGAEKCLRSDPALGRQISNGMLSILFNSNIRPGSPRMMPAP